jgi:hypothetical protein
MKFKSVYEERFTTNFEKGAFYLGVLLGYYLENSDKKGWYLKEAMNIGSRYPELVISISPKLYYALLEQNLDTEEVKVIFARVGEFLLNSTKEEEKERERIGFAFATGMGLWEDVFKEVKTGFKDGDKEKLV